LTELHAKQVALLRQALQHLCPGGRLIYSTCSLEKEENELVIQQISQETPGSWQTTVRLPGLNAGDGFFAAACSR
jgi:16S rRNA (cytosine967-C5)-methyltransferase